MKNPQKAQTLHIETLNDELSVYDWQRLQMHSLNPTAAKVFELCDGQTSPAQMAKRLEAPEAVVWQSLDELGNAHLLSDVPEKPAQYQSMTRQQFLKLGGAVALASIVSIVVPRPAAAQSAAGGGGGGGGGGPACITRTVTVGTIPAPGGATWEQYYAFTTPITAAEIAALGVTYQQHAWTGTSPLVGFNVYTYLANANGGPYANDYMTWGNGDSSPVTDTDARTWTGNEPYNGIRLARLDNGPAWDVGDLTISLCS
ncbi:MAG: PqqD family protein [Anaerolineae bacterium]|nr:PqqD family protein [Anaerolineae bacterium]